MIKNLVKKREIMIKRVGELCFGRLCFTKYLGILLLVGLLLVAACTPRVQNGQVGGVGSDDGQISQISPGGVSSVAGVEQATLESDELSSELATSDADNAAEALDEIEW